MFLKSTKLTLLTIRYNSYGPGQQTRVWTNGHVVLGTLIPGQLRTDKSLKSRMPVSTSIFIYLSLHCICFSIYRQIVRFSPISMNVMVKKNTFFFLSQIYYEWVIIITELDIYTLAIVHNCSIVFSFLNEHKIAQILRAYYWSMRFLLSIILKLSALILWEVLQNGKLDWFAS